MQGRGKWYKQQGSIKLTANVLEYKIIFTDKWKEALSPKKEDAVSIGFNILALASCLLYFEIILLFQAIQSDVIWWQSIS